MDDFCKLCRTYTTLTAVQQEFLKRLLVIFPFLADLAHARVRLYLCLLYTSPSPRARG